MTLNDNDLIALAKKHGAMEVECSDVEALTFTLGELRSLLQDVADAGYERAANSCAKLKTQMQAAGDPAFVAADYCEVDVRNLKGPLPDMSSCVGKEGSK